MMKFAPAGSEGAIAQTTTPLIIFERLEQHLINGERKRTDKCCNKA
jgi:hypothetical protein